MPLQLTAARNARAGIETDRFPPLYRRSSGIFSILLESHADRVEQAGSIDPQRSIFVGWMRIFVRRRDVGHHS